MCALIDRTMACGVVCFDLLAGVLVVAALVARDSRFGSVCRLASRTAEGQGKRRLWLSFCRQSDKAKLHKVSRVSSAGVEIFVFPRRTVVTAAAGS